VSERDQRLFFPLVRAFPANNSIRAKREIAFLVRQLDVSSNLRHEFDWQLFTPEELGDLAHSCRLNTLVACTGFDESTAASAKSPRMQVVMERIGIKLW
jgi:hypothetical protein